MENLANNEQTINYLSAMDIKALRNADHICFSHNDGKGKIRAIKVLKKPTPWEKERDYPIEVNSEFYGSMFHSTSNFDLIKAFYMIHHAPYDKVWLTIASILKPNDVLKLAWHYDGYTNGYCDKNSLHADSLHLEVLRGDKKLEFLVSVGVCEDNTARMIRRNGL